MTFNFTACGICTAITSTGGIIQSPNYPNNYYTPNASGFEFCQYTIGVPPGKRVQLVFQLLNIANTNWGDFVEVSIIRNDSISLEFYHDESSLLIQVIDNSISPAAVLVTLRPGNAGVTTTTSGNSMIVVFEANAGGTTNNGQPAAWQATYSVV